MTAPALRRTRPSLRAIPGLRSGLAETAVRYGWVFMLSVIGLMLFFGVIYARVFLDKSAFDIADFQSEIATQQQLNQQLHLQVSELEAPGRVFGVATELGLIHPDQPPIVVNAIAVGQQSGQQREQVK